MFLPITGLFNPRTSNGGVTYPPLTSTATDYSPFSRKLQVLLVYSALTVYPLLLVLQKTPFAAPLVSIGTIGFTLIISRTVPARKRWSFRWTLAPILVFDTILVLFPVVLSIALDAPAGLVFEIWIKERVPEEWASHTEEGAAGVERLRKGWFEERRLGAEAQIYRFFLLGVWGWVVTGLYRLDVRLRERCGKSSLEEQKGRDGEVQEAASQLESSSDNGTKIITAGTPIDIPSLRSSLHTHSHEALQSLPVYFSTSLLILVGLLLFLPLSLELVEGLEFSDGVSTISPLRSCPFFADSFSSFRLQSSSQQLLSPRRQASSFPSSSLHRSPLSPSPSSRSAGGSSGRFGCTRRLGVG